MALIIYGSIPNDPKPESLRISESIFPDGPENGLPVTSSLVPGDSPTITKGLSAGPLVPHVCVLKGQPSHLFSGTTQFRSGKY